jgi:flavin-dependent dehydrogenase
VTPPPASNAPVLAESLPPSCGKLFALLGVEAGVADAGFVRSTGNTVWWGDGQPRVEYFGQGRLGWQITGAALVRVLLESAREAGADLDYRRASADDPAIARASIVLDCTGRAGVIARARGWRTYESTLKTVALVGIWRQAGAWAVPDDTHTLVESYADGWLWSVPTVSGARYIAAMVDPRLSNLAGDGAREIYLREVAKAPRFAALTAGATCEAGPWGWDASMYSATQYADDRVLLVGDAGSFIDPLSSAGVKKAIASGWLAAVAAHTSLVRPAMRQVASEFFAAREQETYQAFRAMTQRYLGDAAGAHAHPFWTDREIDAPARDDEDLERAFARLRTEPVLSVRLGSVVFEDRPAVAGCEIVLERRVVHASLPDGVRYLHDVDIVTLLERAPRHRDVGELFTDYTSLCGPVELPDFLRALATALARGWLVWV